TDVVASCEALVPDVPDDHQPVAEAALGLFHGTVNGGVVHENDLERRPGLREQRGERILQHDAPIPVDDDRADEWSAHASVAIEGAVAGFLLTTTNSLYVKNLPAQRGNGNENA